MSNRYKWIKARKLIIFSILTDFLILIFLLNINNISTQNFSNQSLNLFDAFLILLVWVCISYVFNRYYFYDFKNIKKLTEKIFSTLMTFIFSFAIFILYFDILINKFSFNSNVLTTLIVFPFISFVFHFLLNFSRDHYILKKEIWLFVGDFENFKKLKKIYEKENATKITINYYDLENKENEIFENNRGIILESINEEQKFEISNLLKKEIQIIDLSRWCEIYMDRIPTELLSNIELLKDVKGGDKIFEERLKRIGDIFISFLLLIFSAPIILLVGILIKIEDGGPLIYSQKRIGKNYSIINIYKIRSMKINSEQHGAKWSTKNDPRITKIGRFIRNTRIDEIPQLISVIKGDMSLIGPRPERPEFYEILQKRIPNFSIRSIIKPGISGWAQVNYPYGSSIEDSRNKLSYDIYYIKNFSLFLDFLILIKTIKIVLLANGR